MTTLGEARAQIEVLIPTWGDAEIVGFLAGTPEERQAILECLKASQACPPPSVWPAVLSVIKGVAELAGAVSGIESGVAAVFALTHLS